MLSDRMSPAACPLRSPQDRLNFALPPQKLAWAVLLAHSIPGHWRRRQIKHTYLVRKPKPRYSGRMLKQQMEITKRQEMIKWKSPCYPQLPWPFPWGPSHRLSPSPRSLTSARAQTAVSSTFIITAWHEEGHHSPDILPEGSFCYWRSLLEKWMQFCCNF